MNTTDPKNHLVEHDEWEQSRLNFALSSHKTYKTSAQSSFNLKPLSIPCIDDCLKEIDTVLKTSAEQPQPTLDAFLKEQENLQTNILLIDNFTTLITNLAHENTRTETLLINTIKEKYQALGKNTPTDTQPDTQPHTVEHLVSSTKAQLRLNLLDETSHPPPHDAHPPSHIVDAFDDILLQHPELCHHFYLEDCFPLCINTQILHYLAAIDFPASFVPFHRMPWFKSIEHHCRRTGACPADIACHCIIVCVLPVLSALIPATQWHSGPQTAGMLAYLCDAQKLLVHYDAAAALKPLAACIYRCFAGWARTAIRQRAFLPAITGLYNYGAFASHGLAKWDGNTRSMLRCVRSMAKGDMPSVVKALFED